jgi:hypothetical protein
VLQRSMTRWAGQPLRMPMGKLTVIQRLVRLGKEGREASVVGVQGMEFERERWVIREA